MFAVTKKSKSQGSPPIVRFSVLRAVALAFIASSALLAPKLSAQAALATVPYLEDFDAGPLGPEWQLAPDPSGGRLVQSIDNQPSPGSGGLALLMDSLSGGFTVTNEARLFVDLDVSGATTLVYLARKPDADDMGEGLFLSDGTTEVLAFSHASLSAAWSEVELDIRMLAVQNGLATGSSFRLIFRQLSQFALPSDGILIDDVRVLPPDDSGQANRSTACLNLSGGRNANGRPPEIGRAGPFFAESSVFDLELLGEPSRPWLLLRGSINPNNAVFPAIGSLDLGLLGTNFSDIEVVLDGNSPRGALDLFAVLDASGRSQLQFGLESFPPGSLGTFQVAVFVSGPDLLHLSAAFELVVVP